MFSMNYGDESDRNPVWSRNPRLFQQQRQQQQRQQQHQQQQHQHQQQQHQHQQQQQHQHQLQQHQQQHQQQQQKQQRSDCFDRLRVEISDDDSHSPVSQTFKAGLGIKKQVTPPLDLSESKRQIESPLDLSVKSRKRCVDTAEYGEARNRFDQSLESATIAKRIYYGQSENSSKFILQDTYGETQYDGSASIRDTLQHSAKMVPGYHPSSQTHTGKPLSSPSTFTSQQYMDVHAQRRPMMTNGASSVQYSQAQLLSAQQMHSFTTARSMHSDVTQSSILGTESVALKGFFEPTQKVTVNTVANKSVHSFQQYASRMPEESGTNTTSSKLQPVSKSKDFLNETGEQRRHLPYVNSIGYLPSHSQGSTHIQQTVSPSEVAILQQKHQQPQLHSMNTLKDNMIDEAKQQQQRRNYFSKSLEFGPITEMHQQLPSRDTHRIVSSKSQTGQYLQPRQVQMSPVTFQGRVRLDNCTPVYTSPKCIRVEQAVPLSDVHHQVPYTLERVQTVPNQAVAFGPQPPLVMGKYQDKHQHVSLASSPASSVYDSRGQYMVVDKHARNDMVLNTRARNDSYTGDEIALHISPQHSVIQRQSGFIPPRNSVQVDAGTARIQFDRARTSEPSQSYVHLQDGDSSHHYMDVMPKDITCIHNHTQGIPVVMAKDNRKPSTEGRLNGASNIRHSPQSNTTQHSDVHCITTRSYDRNRIGRGLQQSNQHKADTVVNSMNKAGACDDSCITVFVSQPDVHVLNTQANSSTVGYGLLTGTNTTSERSIIKGTSGVHKRCLEKDPLSQFLMKELKKKDSDIENPFTNRSRFQKLDKYANIAPIKQINSAQTFSNKDTENNSSSHHSESAHIDDARSVTQSSYTLPLQIAIPGHKTIFNQYVSQPSSTPVSKVETAVTNNPKLMSRKHKILNAFRQEEDEKSSVNIDKDEKVPMESAKYAARRTPKDQQETSHIFPSSPKMPILSPQSEKSRATPLVSPATIEPPTLEETLNVANRSNVDKTKKEINSLEEHLHKLISDAVKGSVSKDNVYETVCRELNSQPQGHKVFLCRQSSLTRNIPVANVAPIIHGKTFLESGGDNAKIESKTTNNDFDEDAKLIEIVTRSLFDSKSDRFSSKTVTMENDVHEHKTIKTDDDTTPIGDAVKGNENGNATRSSTGMKNVTLSRQTDALETVNSIVNTEEEPCKSMKTKMKNPPMKKRLNENKNSQCVEKSKSRKEKTPPTNTQVNENKTVECVKKPKSRKEIARNVFGSFSEIVAQRFSPEKCIIGSNLKRPGPGWTGRIADQEAHDIHMVLNTDYDGDDEDGKDPLGVRRSKQSSTKLQADRLIKQARHRHSSNIEVTSPKRRKLGSIHRERSHSCHRIEYSHSSHRRLSGNCEQNSKGELAIVRQRRPSSLDRQSNQASFSDTEIDQELAAKRAQPGSVQSVDAVSAWNNANNADESTDEEYFQNYEDEFKQFVQTSDNSVSSKKSSTVKKKKTFHFKQKYIFQRKRKANKGRGKLVGQPQSVAQGLDEACSFHEEGHMPFSFSSGIVSDPQSNIPVPPDVRRMASNKDTGETLLHRAARMGLEDVVLYCMATGSVDVNARDNAGYTALHECAVQGGTKIAKHLLMNGADVNCCSTDGIRPIHDAVENDQLEMLRLLLSFGGDPTLSTYAGKSLMKIARTDRMRDYIQAYFSDLNGYKSKIQATPWQFRSSASILESEKNSGCPIFDNLPSDPEDETSDMCTFSAQPLFPVRRLALEPAKRIEDYIFLDDILNGYRLTRHELESQDILSGHVIKQIPSKVVQDAHLNSIFLEIHSGRDDMDSLSAVRIVDSAVIIAKLEKLEATTGKCMKQ